MIFWTWNSADIGMKGHRVGLMDIFILILSQISLWFLVLQLRTDHGASHNHAFLRIMMKVFLVFLQAQRQACQCWASLFVFTPGVQPMGGTIHIRSCHCNQQHLRNPSQTFPEGCSHADSKSHCVDNQGCQNSCAAPSTLKYSSRSEEVGVGGGGGHETWQINNSQFSGTSWN